MTPENRAGDSWEQADQLEGSKRSFHGQLLIRSKTNLPDAHRLNKLVMLTARWGWITQVLGQGAIFVGGLAIGGGFVLIRRGDPFPGRPGIIIGVGVGCMLFAILAQLLARGASRRWASTARG
jgi:hypothetical protein